MRADIDAGAVSLEVDDVLPDLLASALEPTPVGATIASG